MTETAMPADDIGHALVIVVDGVIMTKPAIHQIRQGFHIGGRLHDRVGQIARIHEFPPGLTVAPDFDRFLSLLSGQMDLVNDSGQKM